MKISKVAFLVLVLFSASCGIKSAPIPKSSLNIPYPDAIRVSVRDNGILLENMNDKYTTLAERSDSVREVFMGDLYKRLSFISPRNSYLDSGVKPGVTYIYRFKNFYPEYNTYSPAVTKTIKYYIPVSIKNIKIVLEEKRICINAELSKSTNYISVNLNGKEVGNIKLGQECFALPNSLLLNALLIPYDFDGNPGTPYQETIKRDENMVLLPPQNAKALRQNNDVILSWDKGGIKDEFLLYIRGQDGKLKQLTKTNITIYKYLGADDKKCEEFEISALRGEKESDRIKISSCP